MRTLSLLLFELFIDADEWHDTEDNLVVGIWRALKAVVRRGHNPELMKLEWSCPRAG